MVARQRPASPGKLVSDSGGADALRLQGYTREQVTIEQQDGRTVITTDDGDRIETRGVERVKFDDATDALPAGAAGFAAQGGGTTTVHPTGAGGAGAGGAEDGLAAELDRSDASAQHRIEVEAWIAEDAARRAGRPSTWSSSGWPARTRSRRRCSERPPATTPGAVLDRPGAERGRPAGGGARRDRRQHSGQRERREPGEPAALGHGGGRVGWRRSAPEARGERRPAGG